MFEFKTNTGCNSIESEIEHPLLSDITTLYIPTDSEFIIFVVLPLLDQS